jgi:hypothetical protein
LEGTWTDGSHTKSELFWNQPINCHPAFLATGIVTLPLTSGYSNYFTNPTQAAEYATLLNSLGGSWVANLLFDTTVIFNQQTSISYVNNGNQGYGGTWQLKTNLNISPAPTTMTFTDTGGVVRTIAGVPYAGPVPIGNHTFLWAVTGTYDYVGGSSFAPVKATAPMSFYGEPGLYLFQHYSPRRSQLGHQLPLIRRFQTA